MLHACYLKNLLFLCGRFAALDGGVYGPYRSLASDLDLVPDMALELISFTLELMARPIVFGKSVMAVGVLQAALNRRRAGRLASILRLRPSGRDHE